MAKYINLGRKDEAGGVCVGEKRNAKVRYPTISLVGDQIPEELKDAKNESHCRIEIVVRKVGDSVDTYTKGEPRRIELELRKLAYISKVKKASMKEFQNMNSKEREEYQEKDKEGGY